MALNPELRQLFDMVAKAIELRRKQTPPDTAKQYERLGLRSPQAAELISKEKESGDLQLADLQAQLLGQQYGEEREERLSDEEWEKRLGLDRMDNQQQMQYLQTQLSASAAENEKSREFAKSERIASETYADKTAKDAAKSAKQSALTKLFLGLGLGAITGGVGTAAGLIGGGMVKGAAGNFGKILGGAALGAASGTSGATGLIGQGLQNKSLIDWYKQYGNKFIGPKEESEQNITWL